MSETPTLYAYDAVFHGRLVGALGICYTHRQTVIAADEDAARLKLYATHEHISGIRWVSVVPVPVPAG